jgi:hypothetical protein
VRLLLRLAILLAVLLPANVAAQPLAPKLLPLGRKLQVDHGIFKCFDLPEWKLALSLDDELFRARPKIILLEEKLDLQTEQIEGLTTIRMSLENDLELTKGEVVKMTGLWEEENKARHLAEASRDWWRTAAIAAGGVVVTMATTAYLLR